MPVDQPLITWQARTDETDAWGTAGLHEYTLWLDGGGTYRALCASFSKEDNQCFEYEDCPRTFDTLAAAKAACEHHHATGKWEC